MAPATAASAAQQPKKTSAPALSGVALAAWAQVEHHVPAIRWLPS